MSDGPHQEMTMLIPISKQLLEDTAGVADIINDALRRSLAGEPGVFKPEPPQPTVEDLYDEWSDGHDMNDWRTYLLDTIGDECWRQIAHDAALAAFKAGYEAGYDRGAWENS